MNTQKAYNKRMEKQNLIGTPKQRRRKYKKIIEELGARNISLQDIAKGTKNKGLFDMMDDTEMTMDDIVILSQYGKAMYDGDTRAAEFLRDTVGEKPSTAVDLNVDEGGLSKMSLEDLLELRDLLKQKSDKTCE